MSSKNGISFILMDKWMQSAQANMNVFTDESLHSSKILSSKTVTLLGAFRGALRGRVNPSPPLNSILSQISPFLPHQTHYLLKQFLLDVKRDVFMRDQMQQLHYKLKLVL